MNPMPTLQVDDEGYVHSNQIRFTDEAVGREILSNLTRGDSGAVTTTLEEKKYWIEAFDEPLVVRQIEKGEGGWWKALCAYGFTTPFPIESLTLDEWDRFHGLTDKGVPFVFSRAAQAAFFDLLEEFDDESFTTDRRRYQPSQWLLPKPVISEENFWSQIYRESPKPPWDLGEAHPALKSLAPQLKLPKSRILVLGCGQGHDAAFWAEQGHVVTAVDFSPEAIQRGQQLYGHLQTLTFHQADIFILPQSWAGTFDVIFEHTCFCAVTPERRNDLVKVWRQMLSETGQLIGVFFVFFRPQGPPYGGSEWELRERLRKNFRFLYWTRWKLSPEHRKGIELVVVAQKDKESTRTMGAKK